jgi:hypothetical protein
VSTGVAAAGPPALLSDGTVVFVGSTGEAIGVRRGAVRFRTRIGRGDASAPPVGPIALEDGGAVVATIFDLAMLDAEGNVRTRAATTEPIGAPLLSAPVSGQPRILVIASSGTVYAWSPGREPFRVGGFGSQVDGAAALANDHTLIAVTSAGLHLDVLDLGRGIAVTRAATDTGFFLGPPAMRGDVATLIEYTDTNSFAITLDASGKELARNILASTPTVVLADGGTAPLTLQPHAGVIVDDANDVAFVTPDGSVGVASASGAVDTLGENPCEGGTTPSTSRGAIASLAPAGRGAFLVACAGGVLAKVAAARQQ